MLLLTVAHEQGQNSQPAPAAYMRYQSDDCSLVEFETDYDTWPIGESRKGIGQRNYVIHLRMRDCIPTDPTQSRLVLRLATPHASVQIARITLQRFLVMVWSGTGRYPIEYDSAIRPPHRFGRLTLLSQRLPSPDFTGRERFRCECGRVAYFDWQSVENGTRTSCGACITNGRVGLHPRYWRMALATGCAPVWQDYEAYSRDVPRGWRAYPVDPSRPVGPDNMRLAEYATPRVAQKAESTLLPSAELIRRICGLHPKVFGRQKRLAGTMAKWAEAYPEYRAMIEKWKADPANYVYPPPGEYVPPVRRSPRSLVPPKAGRRGRYEKAVRECLSAGLSVDATIAVTKAPRSVVTIIRQWMLDEKVLGLTAPTAPTPAAPNTEERTDGEPTAARDGTGGDAGLAAGA